MQRRRPRGAEPREIFASSFPATPSLWPTISARAIPIASELEAQRKGNHEIEYVQAPNRQAKVDKGGKIDEGSAGLTSVQYLGARCWSDVHCSSSCACDQERRVILFFQPTNPLHQNILA
jgi:hypothetical protein